DFGLSAFAVFFTQSPSFLAHQKAMQQSRGHNNAQSFFHLQEIPSDNQIRQTLDPVPPQALYPVYDRIYDTLRAAGILQTFRGVHDSTLIALDGTWYHASQKIHCPSCSRLEHKSGEITYYHSAVTPVLVAPANRRSSPCGPSSSPRRMVTPNRIANWPPPNAGWSTTPPAITRAPLPSWATISTPINPSAGARSSTTATSSSSASPTRTKPSTTGSTSCVPAPIWARSSSASRPAVSGTLTLIAGPTTSPWPKVRTP